ncbi:GTPase family protein [Nonomuraea sp. NPDC050540]|uniref:GTPase family protein n=1 Tax=Nonomuraea sp. NPDC050540 TaxID=3364367 RepID=UPI0037B317FA
MRIFRRRDAADKESIEGLTEDDIRLVQGAFRSDFGRRPPTIGVIGVSGTGKSSTINAMFKTALKVGHTRACTKEFMATDLAMKVLKGPARDEPVNLVVVDAPGLGEDVSRDPSYLEQYQERLPGCDIILWIMAARNRAVSLDQQYLRQFWRFHDRMVFAVNQVDIVHPMDWRRSTNLPSVEMEENILDIVRDREQKIGEVIGRRPLVIPFSAARGYNLEALFHALVGSAPEARKFVFDLLKDFSYEEFVPVELTHLIPAHTKEQ